MAEPPPGASRRVALFAGAVVVLLALLSLWTLRGPEPRPLTPPAPARAAPPPPAPPPAPPPPPAPAPAPVPPPDPGPPDPVVPCGVVAGVVLDPDGRPAAGAYVWADEAPGPGATSSALSGEDGRYELKVAPGDHPLHARGQGTATASAAVSLPSADARVEAPPLRLSAGAAIRGRVVDGAGKPRPAIRVRCWCESDQADPTGEVMSDDRRFLFGGDDVLTDAEGKFTLRGLAGGEGTYRVYPVLYEPPALRSEPPERKGVRADGDPLEFRVLAAALLRGIVVDSSTAEPIPCFSVAGRLFSPPDGRFDAELGWEPEVEIGAAGYRSVRVPVRDPAGGGGERRISLEPAEESGILVLLVSGDGGEHVAGLRAQGVVSDYSMWVRSWPEAAREFRVGRTASGSQTIYLSAEGWSPATLTVAIPKDGEARPEAKLRRCGSARVRLLDAKGNVLHHPQEVVLRDGEGAGPPVRWLYTRPQGTALVITEWQFPGAPGGTEMPLAECDGRLVGLLPGTYRLRVKSGDASKDMVFAVVAGEEVEVTLRLGE